MSEQIPQDIQTFAQKDIENIDRLRILLLLFRSPDKEWATYEVAAALYIKPDLAVAGLAQLEVKGLLSGKAGRTYRYHPQTPETAELVTRLAQFDQERPVTLINLIYAKPLDQVRAFADAFRLKKNEE